MKVSKILTVAALCIVGIGAAQAESYQGVHPLTHDRSRAAVRAEAVVAAHSPDPYADGYGADVPATIVSTADPAAVHSEAVVAAHSPDPYADGYGAGVPAVIASSADPAAVHAQAVAVAHDPEPFWDHWLQPNGGVADTQSAMLP
jgi:hypothetical protein